jgi:UDP-2,3-diacylglucosamine pyrophosphatase LpxH
MILEKIDNLKINDEKRYWYMRQSEIVFQATRKLYQRREKQLEQEHTKKKHSSNNNKKADVIKVNRPSVISMVHDDRLDLLVCGFEDSRICKCLSKGTK